ncbi:HTH-type transcriptional repressor YvoA [Pseudoalteromonas sp. THAF3]|uniref:histidine utilization repressor n=1 Tax=Pseudoalteromonas TaxID=53246 RepID=UPI0006B45BC8|nr:MULTISPECIES: histidine utilization repressor [Pseudoalteromonas]MCG7543814.1 histidine utilization repressor [Pseudoalteromonas sp. MM17-2]QFU03676.1 HTH-type transcriptional repressor YvoA [Pseudoalteromonas sp. THAF3]RZF79077.1 histidine utilization repressor [Pseudoalteromonas sp. CO325X]TLX51428.1 histidine utilization repressor [Pseudoalteromonas ruthenica]GAP74709.1 histidine utilization repressor [Pseudoalteromonas sp. SW0106-04]|tara:strand:+ start:374 stop:1087 length:714 start_codon:yes stop_codon:yes gene_type:complete
MSSAKYHQIKDHILTQIRSGQWQEFQRVPSENQLAQQFAVSRMTARRALSELTDAGILTRTQGLGSFVASFKSQSSLLEIRNIADEVRERNHSYSCAPVTLESIDAVAPIAIALGVEPGDQVYHSVLVHFENDAPLQVEERFVNPELAPNYLQQDFHTLTPHEYLSQVAPLTEARHTVEAITPNQQMCTWLNLYNEEPCLQVIRRTWSQRGIVSFARLVSPGSKYRLGGHLTFTKRS